MSDTANRTCFVIAPIGDEDSPTRKRSDGILHHVIAEACKQAGYDEPVRADTIAGPGIITSQVIERLISSAVVVADLTDHNPNVFYELAIRHSFRKPVIQLIQTGQKIPFDVAPLRTVHVDHTDLMSAAAARNEIAGHMKAIQQAPEQADSPVSIAVELAALRSGGSREREMATLLDRMAEIYQLCTSISATLAKTAANPWYRSTNESLPLHTTVGTLGELARVGKIEFGPEAGSSVVFKLAPRSEKDD